MTADQWNLLGPGLVYNLLVQDPESLPHNSQMCKMGVHENPTAVPGGARRPSHRPQLVSGLTKAHSEVLCLRESLERMGWGVGSVLNTSIVT